MRFIHFDEYRNRLAKDDHFSGRPEGRLTYLDEQFSQIILLCHFLFPSEAVTRVFKEKIGLKGIQSFRLIIRRFHRIAKDQELLKTLELNKEEADDRSKTTVELTQKMGPIIDSLIKCSTSHYEDRSAYEYDSDDDAYDLYLDYWVDGETQKAFHDHFGMSAGGSDELSKAASALNLFRSLQTLLTLNYYLVSDQIKTELYKSGSIYVNETIPLPASHDRIMRVKDFELIKEGVGPSLYGKSLSDGEHQLLHTIGLCLLFRHEPVLFLLDEPETHLNPDWRASYITTLRDALEANEDTKNVMREVLLTSHSPFIISDCQPENVLIFEKNKDGHVTHRRPDFNTFGASANLITREVFGRDETIGDFAKEKLKEMIESLEENEKADSRTLVRKIDNQFGDSVEKTMALGKILRKPKDKVD